MYACQWSVKGTKQHRHPACSRMTGKVPFPPLRSTHPLHRSRARPIRDRIEEMVAIGMPVARHPPHRSVRAELPHTAPTSGVWRETARLDTAAEFGHEGANDSQTDQNEPR